MKGFRFYADLPGTSRENTDGPTDKSLLPRRSTVRDLREYAALGGTLNVIALETDVKPYWNGHGYSYECLAAVFGYPNSDTACTGVSPEHLRKCRRIPEQLARQLHPRLFARLDNEG